jgi:hypothetical protein
MSYLDLLLLLHVGAAIVGFGATFSFSVLGPLAANTGGPQGLGLMKGIVKVAKTLVYPAIVIQPVTGALLIFEENLDNNFMDQWWLWVSILVFAAAVFVALVRQTPTIEKMIELAESGRAESPEFAALGKRAGMQGPLLAVMLLVIIFLMVVKPGA